MLGLNYNILVTNQYGCSAEDVLEIKFKTANIYLPNVVSRQSIQSVNGCFYVQSDVDIKYDMTIYDRWGGRVFDQKDIISNNQEEGWLPAYNFNSGVYVYEIRYNVNGEVKSILGDVTLL